jgi:DNA-directed RNA polymerase subunit RPC12/RpoP
VIDDGFIRCPECRGQLLPSGVEVHRFICSTCDRNFQAVLQFIQVPPIVRTEGLLLSDALRDSTPGGGD